MSDDDDDESGEKDGDWARAEANSLKKDLAKVEKDYLESRKAGMRDKATMQYLGPQPEIFGKKKKKKKQIKESKLIKRIDPEVLKALADAPEPSEEESEPVVDESQLLRPSSRPSLLKPMPSTAEILRMAHSMDPQDPSELHDSEEDEVSDEEAASEDEEEAVYEHEDSNQEPAYRNEDDPSDGESNESNDAPVEGNYFAAQSELHYDLAQSSEYAYEQVAEEDAAQFEEAPPKVPGYLMSQELDPFFTDSYDEESGEVEHLSQQVEPLGIEEQVELGDEVSEEEQHLEDEAESDVFLPHSSEVEPAEHEIAEEIVTLHLPTAEQPSETVRSESLGAQQFQDAPNSIEKFEQNRMNDQDSANQASPSKKLSKSENKWPKAKIAERMAARNRNKPAEQESLSEQSPSEVDALVVQAPPIDPDLARQKLLEETISKGVFTTDDFSKGIFMQWQAAMAANSEDGQLSRAERELIGQMNQAPQSEELTDEVNPVETRIQLLVEQFKREADSAQKVKSLPVGDGAGHASASASVQHSGSLRPFAQTASSVAVNLLGRFWSNTTPQAPPQAVSEKRSGRFWGGAKPAPSGEKARFAQPAQGAAMHKPSIKGVDGQAPFQRGKTPEAELKPVPQVKAEVPQVEAKPVPQVKAEVPQVEAELKPVPQVKAEVPQVEAKPVPQVKAEVPQVEAKPVPQVKAEVPQVEPKPAPQVEAEAPQVEAKPVPQVKAEAPKVEPKPVPQVKANAPQVEAKPMPQVKADAPKVEPKPVPQVKTEAPSVQASPASASPRTQGPNIASPNLHPSYSSGANADPLSAAAKSALGVPTQASQQLAPKAELPKIVAPKTTSAPANQFQNRAGQSTPVRKKTTQTRMMGAVEHMDSLAPSRPPAGPVQVPGPIKMKAADPKAPDNKDFKVKFAASAKARLDSEPAPETTPAPRVVSNDALRAPFMQQGSSAAAAAKTSPAKAPPAPASIANPVVSASTVGLNSAVGSRTGGKALSPLAYNPWDSASDSDAGVVHSQAMITPPKDEYDKKHRPGTGAIKKIVSAERVFTYKYPDGSATTVKYNSSNVLVEITIDGGKWKRNATEVGGWIFFDDKGRKQDVMDGELDVTDKGDIVATRKDGYAETQFADGTFQIQYPDKRKEIHYPDGTCVLEDAKGNRTYRSKAGIETKVAHHEKAPAKPKEPVASEKPLRPNRMTELNRKLSNILDYKESQKKWQAYEGQAAEDGITWFKNEKGDILKQDAKDGSNSIYHPDGSWEHIDRHGKVTLHLGDDWANFD